jgi:hypothetical protein
MVRISGGDGAGDSAHRNRVSCRRQATAGGEEKAVDCGSPIELDELIL